MTSSEVDKRDIVVSSMLKIYNYFKSKGGLDYQGEGARFLYWNYPMDNEQKEARQHMDNVLRLIKEHNPELSDESIYQSLLFNLTEKAIWFPLDYSDIESEYRKVADQLLTYTAIRDIDIPIVNLRIEKKVIKFGLMTFHPIEKSDKEGEWWNAIKGTAGRDTNNIYSFARVTCPGDTTKSLDYGTEIVNEMLTILRAIGFPMKPESYHMHFWLVNEHPLFQTRPYRLGLPKENLNLSYTPQIINIIGPGVATCDLEKDILDSIELSALNALQVLIENDFSNPSTEMKRKFFLGLHWLGEATKPDIAESRFVKLFFALEGLIGGGIKNSRDTKIILAKRCAGVRNILWSLLGIIESFKNISELDNTIFGTLPTSRTKPFYKLWKRVTNLLFSNARL